jgi:hypothetical protein
VRHATQGLSRAAELPALQASAALKIESAEHAFNRLVADCAGLCRTLSTPPARDPVPLAGAIRTRSSRVDADPARRALAA